MDMTCFPSFIVRIWPRRVQDVTVGVISGSGRMDSSNKLSSIARITARVQSIPHLPFVYGYVHQRILVQQIQARNANDLVA